MTPRPQWDRLVPEILEHRGPDHFGSWHEDDAISFLHWRLAIIDCSAAGNQPMSSGDSRYVICYNGEIYNFQELRADVEREWRRGASPADDAEGSGTLAARRWRSRSDTEVVIEGFALWGPDFLQRLNGMFALALYDRETRTLHLARDRAGIKPLYVWSRDGVLLFASEAKFFFAMEAFTPAIDADGLAAYLAYGHCHDESHVLAGVRQLEPGEVLTCRAGSTGDASPRVTSSRLAPRPEWRPVRRTDRDATEELKRLMPRVVARQLVADVPVGVLLSGGVDSSILTALAARVMGPERTMAFTLGYPGLGADYDEIAHARRVARHLGIQHHVYEASAGNLVEDLEDLVWHYDEPFADAASLNVYLLSRMMRSRVTVALAGEGSDELFGGYRRYHLEKTIRGAGMLGRQACRIARKGRLDRVGWMPRRLGVVLRALASQNAPARYDSYLRSDVPIESILRPEWNRVVPIHPAIEEGYSDEGEGTVGRLCVVDQRFWLPTTYLEKSDKGAMAHSLEIRVPFLDNEVISFANTLPDDQRIRRGARKWLLRQAFGDLLPPEVFRRFKRGFGVPVGQWLRHELREYYSDQVLAPEARVQRYLRTSVLERCFREHDRGIRDHAGFLWKCLVLEIWLRHFERGFPMDASAPTRMDASNAARPGVVNADVRP